LCTPGTGDLLILSSLNHFQKLLLFHAIDLCGVVADEQREVHAERFDGHLKVLYCMRTDPHDFMKEPTDECSAIVDWAHLFFRK
jgi:hypothetical protein